MMTQYWRHAVAGLIALSSTVLWAAAPAGVEQAGERAPQPEYLAATMEEVRSIGQLLSPHVDMERLEAQLREQTREMTERLNAAIESELRELLAPRFDIDVAGVGSTALAALPAAG